jgi:hypothetical protein
LASLGGYNPCREAAMGRAWLVLGVLGLVACGSGSSGPLPWDADLPTACAHDVSTWRPIVEGLSTSCAVNNDCITVGASEYPCESAPAIGRCDGQVVNRAAYEASGAAPYEQDFRARGCPCPDGCLSDCPIYRPRCIEGACTGVYDECECNPINPDCP